MNFLKILDHSIEFLRILTHSIEFLTILTHPINFPRSFSTYQLVLNPFDRFLERAEVRVGVHKACFHDRARLTRDSSLFDHRE
jgi:hypothetical protein